MWGVVQTVWSAIAAIATRATWVDWALLLAALAAAFYVVGTWTYDFFQRQGVAFHKPKFPFLGSTALAFLGIKVIYDIVIDIYKSGKGHSVFGFFEFQKPIFMIRDPEMLKVVAVKEFDHFPNHRVVASEKADPLFAKNLFSLKDQRWRDMRATLSPAFTTSKMKGMFPLIGECGQQMAQYLQKTYCESPEGTQGKPLTTDVKDLFTRMANDVIATTAFGVSCDSLSQPKNEFYTNGKKMTVFTKLRILIFVGYILFPKIMAKLNLSILNPEAQSFFSDLVLETIKVRQEKGIFRPDMLQLLMQAKAGQLKEEAGDEREDIQTEKKHKLTDEDLVAQAVIFFFAGFETVSTALSFAAVSISHEPEIQKRLQEEVDGIMKKTGGKLNYEAVQGMKYLDMVMNESMRRFPPVPAIDRVCTEAITLPAAGSDGPVPIRKDDIVWVPIYAIHHDPEYWSEPFKFDPERFSDENKHNIKPFTFMPFGLGPRICVGQRFALLEVKLALAHLVAHFELQPSPKTEFPIKFAKGFNANAKGGLWCNLVPRDKSPVVTLTA